MRKPETHTYFLRMYNNDGIIEIPIKDGASWIDDNINYLKSIGYTYTEYAITRKIYLLPPVTEKGEK